MKRTYSIDYFLSKARLAHGDKYDYSKTEYLGMSKKALITCPIHGDFYQKAAHHASGHGCPKCGGSAVLNTMEFIKRAKAIHESKYGYDKVDYKNIRVEVCMICPKHGEFLIAPVSHLDGAGCPKCKEENKQLVFGVGISDIEGSYKSKAYEHWHSMLARCYDKNVLERCPTYQGCSVCDEWLTFSKFKEWFDKEYIEGNALDKDILVKGNKIYSPSTCCFVPIQINTLLIRHAKKRNLPLGVSWNKKKRKFYACMGANGKTIYIGSYDDPNEAYLAYKESREQYIKERAGKYYQEGKLPQRAYEALMNFEVEP